MPNILSQIADNPVLFEALTEHFKEVFEFKAENIPMLTMQQLGEYVAVRLEAGKLLTSALVQIENYKTVQKSGDKVNPAR